MKEKTLLKIALISSVLGVFLLLIVQDNISLDPISPKEIEEKNSGEVVKIIGFISGISNKDNLMFLKISEKRIDEVDVMLFKDHDIHLKENQVVEIVGEVSEYKGKKEIIANKLRLI